MKTLPDPDPAQGLFETLLVLDGEPVELDAHLDRMAASLRELFGAELPAALAASAREHAGGLGRERAGGLDREHAGGLRLGRLRIAVDGAGRAMLATGDVDPADFFPGLGQGTSGQGKGIPPQGQGVPNRERDVELRSLSCAGGLGAHKWADRAFLDEARGEPVPLLFDRGDEVLEAGRGNVFVASGGALRTPPADGRILPGIARAAAIEVARAEGVEVREERLTRERSLRGRGGLPDRFGARRRAGALARRSAASQSGRRGAAPQSGRRGAAPQRGQAQSAAGRGVTPAMASRPAHGGRFVTRDRPRCGAGRSADGAQARHDPVRPLAEVAQGDVLVGRLGQRRVGAERRVGGAFGHFGGTAGLLGGIESGVADRHHRLLRRLWR